MDQYGYYDYKGKHYYDRHHMMDMMLAENDHEGNFQFIFNDDIFTKINWEEEPDFSILDLYRMRAEQIRQKYNYVILLFSGGADSVQILRTFLDNNIFIDEIQCYHCSKGIEKIESPENKNMVDMLEYEYSSKKYLQRVINESPKTKITLIDMTDSIYDQLHNKKFTYLGLTNQFNNHGLLPYNHYTRIFSYVMFKYNHERGEKKRNTCIVRGIDKPKFAMINGFLYFYFMDVSLIYVKNILLGTVPDIGTFENFYWSPDAPLIPVKQSHMILNTFKQKKLIRSYYEDIRNELIRLYNDHEISWYSKNILTSERIFANIIYPEWALSNNYTGLKESGSLPVDFMLLNYMNIEHNGQDAIKEYREFIAKKYSKIRNKTVLTKFIPSRFYKVGKLY